MTKRDDDGKPTPPAGTRAAGRRLWESAVAEYDLDEHELALLVEAVRTVDLLGRLDPAARPARHGAETTAAGRSAGPASRSGASHARPGGASRRPGLRDAPPAAAGAVRQ